MAALTTTDRSVVWADAMRQFSTLTLPCGITKPALRAAVDAADDWADTNASSYNLALPQPARSSLTAKQKALILAFVILRRYEVS